MGGKCSGLLNRLRKNNTGPNMDEKLEEIILHGFLKPPRATEEEVMKQLQEEGIIPTLRRQGGVAFEVPLVADKPRGQAPRRLCQYNSHKKSLWSREEKMIIAGIQKEEHLDLRRKNARKEEEKRRRVAERKILRQMNRSEKLYRKMAAVENRKRELVLLKKRVLPPIHKDV